MDNVFSFGQTLKSIRTEKGITQNQLALDLGVHYQTVSKWERDVVLPDIAMFDSLSKALNVSISTLLGQDDGNLPSASSFSTERLASTICIIRKNLGLSQLEFANKIEVRADTISKWERGVICPDILLILHIAKTFQLKVEDVYYGNVGAVQSQPKKKVKHTKRTSRVWLIAIILVVVAIGVVALVIGLSGGSGTTFVFPVENGNIIVHHDDFYHSFTLNTYGPHNGYDIYGNEGAKVYAMFSGTITEITQDLLYPHVITIASDDGYTATYKYVLIDASLNVGDTVRKGQVIGTVNCGEIGAEANWEAACTHFQLEMDKLNSGEYPSHIHMELYLNGVMVSSIDRFFQK